MPRKEMCIRDRVVAAIRYITNGTYLSIIKEMLENEVSDDLKPLKERVAKLVELSEAAINKVKEANDQAVHDFLARRLYNMTGDIVMSLLILSLIHILCVVSTYSCCPFVTASASCFPISWAF